MAIRVVIWLFFFVVAFFYYDSSHGTAVSGGITGTVAAFTLTGKTLLVLVQYLVVLVGSIGFQRHARGVRRSAAERSYAR